MADRKTDRAARLKAALRANLRKRRAQAHGGSADNPEAADSGADSGPGDSAAGAPAAEHSGAGAG